MERRKFLAILLLATLIIGIYFLFERGSSLTGLMVNLWGILMPFFLGGVLVDEVFSPLMAAIPPGGMLDKLFGGPGAGAAATFCVLAVLGVAVCAAFLFLLRRDSWRDGDALQ